MFIIVTLGFGYTLDIRYWMSTLDIVTLENIYFFGNSFRGGVRLLDLFYGPCLGASSLSSIWEGPDGIYFDF